MARTKNRTKSKALVSNPNPQKRTRRRKAKKTLQKAHNIMENVITDVLTMLQDESIQSSEISYQIDLFNDLDLAVLGSSPDDYANYSRSLQKEYGTDSYRRDRLKMLKTLLMIPSIYSSEPLREKFEASARRNIQSEIEDSQN